MDPCSASADDAALEPGLVVTRSLAGRSKRVERPPPPQQPAPTQLKPNRPGGGGATGSMVFASSGLYER